MTAPLTFDGATVYVHPDVAALGRAAADQAAALMRRPSRRGVAHVMFATGNSQLAFVDALVTQHPTCPGPTPWSSTWTSTWASGPTIRPASSGGSGEDRRSPSPRAAHYVEGLGDPGAECRRYAELLRPIRSICAAWASARTGIWPSTTPPWPTSTILSTSRWSSSRRLPPTTGQRGALRRPGGRPDPGPDGHHSRPAAGRPGSGHRARGAQGRSGARALTGPMSTACPASALRTITHATIHLEPRRPGCGPAEAEKKKKKTRRSTTVNPISDLSGPRRARGQRVLGRRRPDRRSPVVGRHPARGLDGPGPGGPHRQHPTAGPGHLGWAQGRPARRRR